MWASCVIIHSVFSTFGILFGNILKEILIVGPFCHKI